MGIRINEKEYGWGEIFIYALLAYTAFKVLVAIFGSSNSDCIEYGMKEYGYTYDQAKQECQDSKSESLDR